MGYHSSRAKAYSLIEIIVALAIVAILAGLVLSMIGKVRELTRTAECSANLRTLGVAALTYFTDRDGYFLPTRFWEIYPSWGPSGKQGMRDYLGIEANQINISGIDEYYRDTLVSCPSMRISYPNITTPLHRTYSFNYYLNQKDPSSAYNHLPSMQRPDLATGYRTLLNVPNPSVMWMFTDGIARSEYFGTNISNSSVIPELSFPHGGRQNLVFMDGHVESLNLPSFLERAENADFWGRLD